MPLSGTNTASRVIAGPGRPTSTIAPATARAGSRLPPSAIVVLIGGTLATLLLVALTLADVGGQAVLWENGHWTIASLTAFGLGIIGYRSAGDDDRRIRGWAMAIAGVWFGGQMVWNVEIPLGLAESFPTPDDAVFIAAAIPTIGWLAASLHPRLSRTAKVTILIDTAAVAVAVAGALVIADGSVAEAVGGLGAFLLLAYPVIYLVGAAAALVIIFEQSGLRAAPRGSLLLALGLVLVGLSWTGWLSAAAAGLEVPTGSAANVLFSIGFLVSGAGMATAGRPHPTRLDDTGSALGEMIPVGTAIVGVLVVLVLDDRLNGLTETGVRVAVAATIVVIVLRQTVLLRDRGKVLARVRGATAHAESAISEARRTADLLAVAEKRYRHLVEQVPAAVYLDRLDVDELAITETVYISPRIEALTGFTPAEIAADNNLWFDRIHVDDQPAVLEDWDRHCRSRTPFSATYRFRAKDGRTVWLAEDAGVLETEGDVFSQGTILDVTERRETEARLRQAHKMEAVGQLAGGVAHDFNNLLTVITGHAGLLLETTAAGDPSRVDIDAIASAAASSAELVGQLLAFGRRQMLRPEILDLSAVVSDVLPMLRRLLPEHIDVVTRLDPALSSVRADPSQIQQVVLNLAINGRDAMPAGGALSIATDERLVSETEAAQHLGLVAGRYVQLTISDEGVGMDAATRDRVFEPFFTTKAAGRGTGLGLATVYGIVKQSDGYISLESAVNRGSTFRVLLPATSEPARVRLVPSPVRGPRGRERIVLCEDEPAVRDLVAAVLRRSGYDIVTATHPTEALLLVADTQSPADLLLTDVVMPGMSGPDLARRARALRPDLRVVLMSGYALDAADRLAVGRQAAFLAKPFTPTVLARTVRDVLDGLPAPEDSASPAEEAARG